MPIGDLLAQITGEPSPTTTTFPAPTKSRSDEGPRRPLDKAKQPSSTHVASSSKPAIDLKKASAVPVKPKAPTNGSSRVAATTFQNGQPTPPPSNDTPKAPPKKGSYAEIMARGQAAQKVLGQVGKIQHKKIEKPLSRREKEELRTQKVGKIQKGLAPNSKFQRAGQSSIPDGKNTTGKRARPSEPVPEKKVKKAALATTGYAGTARPKAGTTGRHSSKSGSSSRRSHGYYEREGSGYRGARYADEDEDAEEDDEEEGSGFESDASSDMEAAAFEVDEEELLAERIARREDAEALAEENRLKREKAEKKRRLMAMAKKAKPMSY